MYTGATQVPACTATSNKAREYGSSEYACSCTAIQLLYSLLTLTVRDPQGGGKANCTSVLLDTESVL